MPIKPIASYQELIESLKKDQKNYLLLYKSGTDASECSIKNLQVAAEKAGTASIMTADVNQVRDIHTRFNVSSAPSLLVFEGEQFINVVKGCNEPAYYISLFEESYFHPLSGENSPRQKHVTVYTTPSCSWCTTLKRYLRSNNIRFSEVDVSQNQQAAEQMVRKSGQQGVPQTHIEGQIIVGFDKNRINTLLGIQHSNN